MAYVNLSSPRVIGNTAQNTGQFSTLGVGAAAVTSAAYVNATNRIGLWITGSNVSSAGSDADGLFIDTSFAPTLSISNAASIGLYPTFAPPGGVTITIGYGLYIASGTQSGAGAVTTGYGLFVTAPTFGSSQVTAQLDNIRLNANTISVTNSNGTLDVTSAGTGTITVGANATAHQTTLGSTNSTSSTTVQSGSGALAVTSTNGTLTINSGTGALSISSDASSTTVNLGTGGAVKTVTLGSTNSTSVTTLQAGSGGVKLGSSTEGAVVTSSTAVLSSVTGTAGFVLTANTAGTAPSFKAMNGGLVWNDVSGATQTIAVSNGYLSDRSGTVAFTLPANATIGDVFRIVGVQGAWTLAQAANQQIKFGSTATTLGATGSLASTDAGDSIECVATNTSASTIWRVMSSIGNITVA